MTAEKKKFVVPSLMNSGFGAGKVCWSLFHEAATWAHEGRRIEELDFSGVVHLKPYAVAIVVALASRFGDNFMDSVPPNDAAARDHLIRLGVPDAIGADWGNAVIRPTNVPLQIVTDRPPADFSFQTASMLAAEFSGGLPAGVTAKIADCIDEIVLNALGHSESPTGCVVVGQAFPGQDAIEAAIVDLGITIRGHLSRQFPVLATDEKAIIRAVEEGVTGTPPGKVNRLGDPNSGVGLSDLKGFVEATDGELSILSGSALVTFGVKAGSQPLTGRPFPGTLVNVRFNTNPGSGRQRPKSRIYY